MKWHKPKRYWMEKHNPCWIGLYQLYQITCISYCHRIHLSAGSSLHLPYLPFHWNSARMPGLARSILEVCWNRTLCFLFHLLQIYLKLYLVHFLYLATTFLVHLSEPLAVELSSFLGLWIQAHLFHIILLQATSERHLCFLVLSLGFLCNRRLKTLFQAYSTLLCLDIRWCL